MQAVLLRILESLFPVQRHEWPKALMLLSVAALLGVGFTVSRAASEAMFLIHFGIDYLPYLLLVNPMLVLVSSAIYGAYADRIPDDRLMIYTALLPVPLIVLLRLAMLGGMGWVYFVLYTFMLAYAAILTTSWTVYLAGHYDVQEAKRLLPFITSGLLIGTVIGGVGVGLCVPLIGSANVLLLWAGTLVATVAVVHSITRLFTAIDTKVHKTKRAAPKPLLRQSIAEGIAYSRFSALFTTTAIASIATMMAIQLIDFEYSKIFARQFPDSAQLTAFLGLVDGLTTVFALGIQWCIVPRCIRRLGVQGTNLLFPYTLVAAFGGLLVAPMLLPAMFARFTRYSLMPSWRDTTRTRILNAVPCKISALVRSFNTDIVMPLGQGAGAILLIMLKGVALPWLFPALGLLITVAFLVYSYKQNVAYGEALLNILKEDRIHLLDLEDEDIRQFDNVAVTAISEWLKSDQEDVTLAAIALLRTIGSPAARYALLQHLPFVSPRVTAAALQALASLGGEGTGALLHPYLDAAQPQVRMAALQGLQQLGDATVRQRAASLLDDPDVQVCAAALVVVLADPQGAEYDHAHRNWETMRDSEDKETQIAALSIIADVQEAGVQEYLYRALGRADGDIRRGVLRALTQLAEAGRLTALDAALLGALKDEAVESRELALRVLAAVGSDEALHHMLVLLDDAQPAVRETLIKSVKSFGKRAIDPLISHLQSPQSSLVVKESAWLALARLDGVQPDQLLPFWQGSLREVYQHKLMLACMDAYGTQEEDTFLRVALQNAYDQMLSLLTQLLAVWASPEVVRLVSYSLYDTDRQQCAPALEAIKSLSERRFTRLFLPLVEATGTRDESWRDVAQQQWNLHFGDMAAIIEACLQSTDTWVLIGAVLAGQARASTLDGWRERLEQIATTATHVAVVNVVRRALGFEVEELHRYLSLTEAMLFLKRIPLYRSMGLDQLYTITTNLVEREMQDGAGIFREGDWYHEFYMIVSGQIDIGRQRPDWTEAFVTLSAGDYCGSMAIFHYHSGSVGAVAVGATVLLVLSPERFRNVILQEPAIAFEIFRALSSRPGRLGFKDFFDWIP